MREILFRGKLTAKGANGAWAYGNLRVVPDGTYIVTPDETVLGKYGVVNPDTVGQYTGLTDKHGTKIFEGDIVGHSLYGLGARGTVIYRSGAFVLNDHNLCSYSSMRVHGNIHDNGGKEA